MEKVAKNIQFAFGIKAWGGRFVTGGFKMSGTLCRLFIIGAVFLSTQVYAIPFSSEITITGGTTYENLGTSAIVGGSLSAIQGGVTSSVGYLGNTGILNQAPLALTDIGDKVGFDGTVSTKNDEFGIAIDNSLTITNNSLTDSYNIELRLNVSNFVDADGGDAYSDSELTLDIDGTEEYFSDIVSDTVVGDSEGGTDITTYGDELSDGTSSLYLISLSAGASASLLMEWLFEGGDYASGLAKGMLSASLTVESVSNTTTGGPGPVGPTVSEPGTLALLMSGLMALAYVRRCRT